MIKTLLISILISMMAIATGCGYRMANSISDWPVGVSMVYVETIRNRTTEPGLDRVLTEAIIKELWHWPGIKVVSRSSAEGVLSGVITEYKADSPLSFDRNQNIREYELMIRVNLQLERAGSEGAKKILWPTREYESKVSYQFFENDLGRTRAEQERAKIKAAKDLAQGLFF